jgi:hypothetical protein
LFVRRLIVPFGFYPLPGGRMSKGRDFLAKIGQICRRPKEPIRPRVSQGGSKTLSRRNSLPTTLHGQIRVGACSVRTLYH